MLLVQNTGDFRHGPVWTFFRRKYFGIGMYSLSAFISSAGEEGDKTSRCEIDFGLVRFLGDTGFIKFL
jgi:hypothetical protein